LNKEVVMSFVYRALSPRGQETRGPGALHLWALLLAAALILAAAPAAAADPDDVVHEEADSSREDAEAFWTEERIQEARPMPMPDVSPAEAAAQLQAKGRTASGTLLAPSLRPGETLIPFRPDDAASGPTLAPKWGTAPWVYSRYRLFPDNVATYTTYPYRTVGKLFFQIPGVGLFVCSASVVTAQNLSTVWTAGHCVYSPPPGTGGYVGFHTNFMFMPARRTGFNPLGVWTHRVAATTIGWQFGLLEYDHGVLVMNRGGLANLHVGSVTGSLGFLTGVKDFQHFHAIGYPQAPRNLATTQPGLQFNGEFQEICTATWAASDLPTGGPGDPPTLGIGCDQTGGTSGGPWVINFSGFQNAQNNLLNGNSSYRYTGPNPPANLRLFGPHFGTAASVLWNFAQSFPVP
jgi:V8-like Glu-specific endopeptidase